MATIFIAGYKLRFKSSDLRELPHIYVIHGVNDGENLA